MAEAASLCQLPEFSIAFWCVDLVDKFQRYRCTRAIEERKARVAAAVLLSLVEGNYLVLLVLIEAQMAAAAYILTLLCAAKQQAAVLRSFVIEEQDSSCLAVGKLMLLTLENKARCGRRI